MPKSNKRALEEILAMAASLKKRVRSALDDLPYAPQKKEESDCVDSSDDEGGGSSSDEDEGDGSSSDEDEGGGSSSDEDEGGASDDDEDEGGSSDEGEGGSSDEDEAPVPPGPWELPLRSQCRNFQEELSVRFGGSPPPGQPLQQTDHPFTMLEKLRTGSAVWGDSQTGDMLLIKADGTSAHFWMPGPLGHSWRPGHCRSSKEHLKAAFDASPCEIVALAHRSSKLLFVVGELYVQDQEMPKVLSGVRYNDDLKDVELLFQEMVPWGDMVELLSETGRLEEASQHSLWHDMSEKRKGPFADRVFVFSAGQAAFGGASDDNDDLRECQSGRDLRSSTYTQPRLYLGRDLPPSDANPEGLIISPGWVWNTRMEAGLPKSELRFDTDLDPRDHAVEEDRYKQALLACLPFASRSGRVATKGDYAVWSHSISCAADDDEKRFLIADDEKRLRMLREYHKIV